MLFPATANANFRQHPCKCHVMMGERDLHLANTKPGLKIFTGKLSDRLFCSSDPVFLFNGEFHVWCPLLFLPVLL